MPKTAISLNSFIIGNISIESGNIMCDADSLYPLMSVNALINMNPKSISIKNKSNNSKKMEENYTLLGIDGDLFFLDNQNFTWRLGDFHSGPIMNFSRRYDAYPKISIPLDYYRLKLLEEKRRKNIRLRFNFSSIVAVHPLIPIGNTEKNYSIKMLETSESILDVSIPESEWIDKVINNSGLTKKRFIEISIPQNVIPKVYNQALSELDIANNYLYKAEYDKCVIHCRRAIDIIPKVLKTKQIKPNPSYQEKIKSFLDQHLKNDLSNSKREMILSFLATIWRTASGANHSSQADFYTRADAETIMTISAALLSYIGKAIDSKIK